MRGFSRILFFSFFLFFCIIIQQIHAQNISVIKTSKQIIFPGIPGGLVKTNFKIELLASKKNPIIEGVWAEKNFYKEYTSEIKPGNKKDTLIIHFVFMDKRSFPDTSSLKLQYVKGKKSRCILIDKIATEESQYMP